MTARDVPPRWDRRMQQRLARGEAAALGELYDRFASLVHGLAHRVLGDERAADAITRDVFAHVWQHPDSYDPKRGPLRTWLAALTSRLAVQRLRTTETAALARGGPGTTEDLERKVRHASVTARADYIVHSCRRRCGPRWSWRTSSAGTTTRPPSTWASPTTRPAAGSAWACKLLATAHDAGTPGTPPEIGGAA
ncbi:hypothetical protein SGRIM128S_08047 [Streptomyces griseomycini]